MRIQQLRLQNFRNYEDQLLTAVPGDNIFVGQNAQGKTNILEAIFLMTCARSHRTGRDPELIRQGADHYRIELTFSGWRGEDQELVIFYQDLDKSSDRELVRNLASHKRKRREITYQGARLESLAELYGLFQAVIFAPEDLQLVKGAPSERRRFIDLLLSKVDQNYFRHLQQFQQILRERNQLLKQAKRSKNQFLQLQLELWTERLAAAGAELIQRRILAIEELTLFAQAALDTLSAGRERLAISYESYEHFQPEQSLEEISESYRQRLERSLQEDILRGSTSYGPQRDDLGLEINELQAKIYASQGQQRSLALALRIAELKYIEAETSERAVLLLDDVLSELDPKRRTALFTAVESEQVFLTCADSEQVISSLAALGCSTNPGDAHRCALFKVESGQLERA